MNEKKETVNSETSLDNSAQISPKEIQSYTGKETLSDNIQGIMRERIRIDQMIKEKFKKETSILFTDICGYTQYMDTMADINGLTKLQRHNDIVLPLVEKHDGVLIKMIGDAVMATFSKPLDAVAAAIAIQKSLQTHNRIQDMEIEQIHVKIGVNTGNVIVDKSDIFGDAVNVAARIQAQAGKDQIFISKSVYEHIAEIKDIFCEFSRFATVKGKSEPIALYEIFWDGKPASRESVKVRAGRSEVIKKIKPDPEVIHLELTREGSCLKIGVYEQKMENISTVRHYEEISITLDRIDARCQEFLDILNHADGKGMIGKESLAKLREHGRMFRDELFTSTVKENLAKTTASHLILNLDDGLIHIPWELLYDGHQFLCCQFNVGRLVKTRQTLSQTQERVLESPLKMLILADPNGDLEGACHEGKQLLLQSKAKEGITTAELKLNKITPEFVKSNISEFDLIHFAGHAVYNRENPGESGWQLSDGNFNAKEIMNISRERPMPAFVFSNACQSAGTEKWEINKDFHNQIFGLVNAFLLSGVKHCVGTFWEIQDEPSSYFSLEFYKCLFSGDTVGESLRNARINLIENFGEESIIWASYLLYGDPAYRYTNHNGNSSQYGQTLKTRVSMEIPNKQMQDSDTISDTEKKAKKRRLTVWGSIFFILMAAVFFGYQGYTDKTIHNYENAAFAYFNQGNFEEALKMCALLEKKSHHNLLSYLIRGDIYLRTGTLETAESMYQKALENVKGEPPHQAAAFIGLGRIASLRQQTDTSIGYYQKAVEIDPKNETGYLSQAIVMADTGKPKQALELLEQARKLAPGSQSVALLANNLREKISVSNDEKHQEKIDKMVRDLLDNMSNPSERTPSDEWTSVPLTMWIRDIDVQGVSIQEGEAQLMATGIMDLLIQHSRVQVVERALLDKLLGELKLSTTKLIDQRTALAVGKILAAKLILSGRIIHSGSMTQVSMQLIETETGRISVVVTDSFGVSQSVSAIAGTIAQSLTEKIHAAYRLQGAVMESTDGRIKINIGKHQGVKINQRFNLVHQKDVILEIIEMENDASIARVINGDGTALAGARVVEELPR
ncbi:MAG: CHAT domain-containing protein [Pseudomonadota bacterium]